MPGLVPWVSATLLLATAAVLPARSTTQNEKRRIVVTAVEAKGATSVHKEPFPSAALPEGRGFRLNKPDQSGRWEVSVYVFDPRQILVEEGDEVTLEFVDINGASHPTTITGYGQTFELKRGELRRIAFTADRIGVFQIVCATHHPTMVAELIVRPRLKG